MLIYYILYLGILFLGMILCETRQDKKWQGIVFICVVSAVLIALSGLRYDVGYDYTSYTNIYQEIVEMDPWSLLSQMRYEKGYLFINHLVAEIAGFDQQLLFWVIGGIITILVAVYVYKNSSNLWLSMLGYLGMGFFFYSLCFMRQMMAAAVVLFGLRYIESKQFVRFLIVVALAGMFHVSAFIMIPFFFILQIPMTVITAAIYSVISGVIFFNSEWIMEIATRYVYKGYQPESIHMQLGIGIGHFLIMAVVFLLGLLLSKQLREKNTFNNIVLNCAFFGMFFELIGLKHSIISRFNVLFGLAPALLLIPQILEILHEKVLLKITTWKPAVARLALQAGTVVFYMGTMTFYMLDNSTGIVPYLFQFGRI